MQTLKSIAWWEPVSCGAVGRGKVGRGSCGGGLRASLCGGAELMGPWTEAYSLGVPGPSKACGPRVSGPKLTV